MSEKRTWTRRNVLRTGGALAGVSAMAGCIGDDGSSDGESEYTVSMPPVGDVEFEGVPENWAANNGSWADMGIALGQDPPAALYLTHRYHTQYYDEIPDVSVDPDEDDIDALWEDELTVEEFMDLSEDVDVFVMDPNFLKGQGEWSDDDIDQVASTGVPFFGNSIFSRDYGFHDDYEYLTLYEAFEKLAEVFQEEERYEEFEALHDEFQTTLEDTVPADDPQVAVLWPQDDVFLPYIVDEGTSYKPLQDLGYEDALANTNVEDFHSGRGEVDYETLLEIDPDNILLRSEEYETREEFVQGTVEPMKDHDAAQQLTAVQNDDIYRAGPLYQGPIINLAVTQQLAERLYGIDEQLYDPQEVSDIVNGDF